MVLGEVDFFFNLGWIVVVAAIFSFIGRLIKMPSIVVYIMAGILLGPIFLIVELNHSLELISELGIALLLFLVGLELSLDKIKDVGKVAIVAGIGQVVFTAAGGFILCMVLNFSVMESLFIATALTFSSTVVVVKLLDLRGDLDRLYGRIAVGIFLVQDLVVVIVLTFLAGLGTGDETSLEFWPVTIGLLKAFGGMTLILGIALIASKYALPKPFAWAARSPDTIFIWALCWCFGIVYLAEVLELSLEIGAFLAGLALAQLPYNDDLRRRLHPLMNFFIAVFFVSLGLQMDFNDALESWPVAIILSLFVLIGNPLIFIIIIIRMGYAEKVAFQTSVTVAQISEFSFIFATMGVASGLIGNNILSIVALVGVVTITVSAYMIIYSDQLYRFATKLGLLRIFGASKEEPEEKEKKLKDHIVVVGMNSLGKKIVHKMCERGYTVLAIDTDPQKLKGLPCHTFLGNVEYESVVNEIGLAEAKMGISSLQIEDTNQLFSYRCRAFGIPCAVHAFNESVVNDLIELDVNYLFMPTIDGVVNQEEFLQEQGVLPNE